MFAEKGQKHSTTVHNPKKVDPNDPLEVLTASGGKGGWSRYSGVIHKDMHGSMSFSDLDQHTFEILLGAHIGDVMRYDNSALR
jgi:hypothetical protein